MRGLRADLAHALRIYRRTPVASVLAVAVLAVAMAFVISFMSLYADLASTMHPGFEDSRELITVGQSDGTNIEWATIALLERMRDEVVALDAVAGLQGMLLQIGAEREQGFVELVTPGFFDGLNPRLALGTGFTERDHDAGAEPVIVISHAVWQQRFDGDPDVIGQQLELTGRPQFVESEDEDAAPAGVPETTTTDFRIVGVMSESLPSVLSNVTVAWMPLELGAPKYMGPLESLRTNSRMLRAIGRRAAGTGLDAITAELDARYRDAEDLGLDAGKPFEALQGIVLNAGADRNSRRQLALFLAGSILVALVAAANVSLFLMSRAPGRRRELGIRMAVGAPVRRIARQLASEAGLLVVAATLLGLLASFWLRNFLKGLAFLERTLWRDASMLDWRVAAIVIVFLFTLTVLVSIAPVRGLRRLSIAASSRQISTRANLAQQLACSAQIAIAGVVAAVAIGFGWYLGRIVADDHGYDASGIHLLTIGADATSGGFFSFDGLEAALVDRERRRDLIGAIPGIDGVSFASAAPGLNSVNMSFGFPSPADPAESVAFNVVSADRTFFELFSIDLQGGRFYDNDEVAALIVSETAARLAWGRTDVVGETLPIDLPEAESLEVVGVVPDVPYSHPEATPEARAYVPLFPFVGIDYVLLRSELPTAEVRARVQGLVDAGDIDGVIRDLEFLPDRISDLLAPDRARSLMTIASAVLVLVLAGFGFYGTQRFLVAAGRREYAIRASLGAGPASLGRLVMQRGLTLGLPGIVLGALGAFIVAAWLRDEFVSRDVVPGIVTLAVVAGLVVLLIAGSLGPARQARAMQPAPLLREE